MEAGGTIGVGGSESIGISYTFVRIFGGVEALSAIGIWDTLCPSLDISTLLLRARIAIEHAK